MVNKDITTTRGFVDFLAKEGELLVTTKEVDPLCEPAAVNKAFEDGPAVLFENVKGYPNNRLLVNAFGRRARMAKIFGVPEYRDVKFQILEAIKNPIPPVLVDSAPCQQVVITKDIDVLMTMPVTQVTEIDPGRIIGGGISLFSGPEIGHCVAHRRTHFRGKDWASMAIMPGGHVYPSLLELAKEGGKLPVTLNICCPAAVMTLAAGGMMKLSVPRGTDELAIAGGLQGAPVEICRAKTVDAYAIADSEWVIEGYVDTSQVIWESDEAERTGSLWASPFFPEWRGYQGWSHDTFKFQATAITHKQDNPIFYAGTAGTLDEYARVSPLTEGTLYDLGNRMCPGLVQDVYVPDAMCGKAGVIFQVKKGRSTDDWAAKNLIPLAFGASPILQMVIVADEDVNIYSAEHILWALMTRVNVKEDIMDFGEGRTRTGPAFDQTKVLPKVGVSGRMGIDATIPFDRKAMWIPGKYPKVDLKKWFTEEEVAKVRAQQNEYNRFRADSGF